MFKTVFGFFLLACTMFVFLQMRPTNKKLRTEETPIGILNLEFAYDIHSTFKVLNAWSVDGKIDAAKKNTYIDFAFLFFYSLFLFYACWQLSKKFPGRVGSFGLLIAKGALIAGGLDVIENSGMLITLSGYQSIFISLITATCAAIKWLLAVLAILYVVCLSPAALYVSAKNKNAEGPK